MSVSVGPAEREDVLGGSGGGTSLVELVPFPFSFSFCSCFGGMTVCFAAEAAGANGFAMLLPDRTDGGFRPDGRGAADTPVATGTAVPTGAPGSAECVECVVSAVTTGATGTADFSITTGVTGESYSAF